MKDQATHIRLIRDKDGKPVEAEYGVKSVNWQSEIDTIRDFLYWAKTNRIPVTGDWPEDKHVFAMDEVEPIFVQTGITADGFGATAIQKLRLKATPKQEAKTADIRQFIRYYLGYQVYDDLDKVPILHLEQLEKLLDAYKQETQQELIEKVKQLQAENEALKKRLEENRKSFRADLHHLRKHKAKLTAENERLREAVGGCIETLKVDLSNAVEAQEQQIGVEFNRGREAGLTYAIEMVLAHIHVAGINLTP